MVGRSLTNWQEFQFNVLSIKSSCCKNKKQLGWPAQGNKYKFFKKFVFVRLVLNWSMRPRSTQTNLTFFKCCHRLDFSFIIFLQTWNTKEFYSTNPTWFDEFAAQICTDKSEGNIRQCKSEAKIVHQQSCKYVC